MYRFCAHQDQATRLVFAAVFSAYLLEAAERGFCSFGAMELARAVCIVCIHRLHLQCKSIEPKCLSFCRFVTLLDDPQGHEHSTLCLSQCSSRYPSASLSSTPNQSWLSVLNLSQASFSVANTAPEIMRCSVVASCGICCKPFQHIPQTKRQKIDPNSPYQDAPSQ